MPKQYDQHFGFDKGRSPSNYNTELDELKIAIGRESGAFDEVIKYFVSGKGNSKPIEEVPEHIRDRVREQREAIKEG